MSLVAKQMTTVPYIRPTKDSWWFSTERMEGERENIENVSALSAGVYTTTWLMMVTLSLPVVCISKIFRHGNKNTPLLVVVHSPLFNGTWQ